MEDVHSMSLQSSHQDLSLEDEKAKKEDRPSSSHLSTRSGTIWTKKHLAMTNQNREKNTITVSGQNTQDAVYWVNLTRAQDKGLRCRTCIQFCAGRLHLQSDFSKRGTNFIRETLYASSRAEDCTEECLAIAAAAARHLWEWVFSHRATGAGLMTRTRTWPRMFQPRRTLRGGVGRSESRTFPDVVRKARALEMEKYRKMHVCERDPARSASKFEWNIFPGLASLEILQKIQEDLRERNIEPEKIHRPDHLHVNVQRHRLDKEGQFRNVYFEFRKSQGLREEILAKTLEVSGSSRGKEVVWNSSLHTWRKMGFHRRTDGGTIPRNRSSSIQEHQCFWVEEFWEERMAETPYTSMRMVQNTELLFRIIHSVNQLSIHGAVSNWCEQFGLTEEEKGQEKQRIRDQRCIDMCEITTSKTFGISCKTGIWKQFAGTHSGLRIADRDKLIHKGFANLHRFIWHRVSAGMNYKTRPDEDEGFGHIIPLCREYTLSQMNPQSRAFAALPGGTIVGPVIEIQIVKILDQCGLEIAIPTLNDTERTPNVMISRG